jgi:hypothetical protein
MNEQSFDAEHPSIPSNQIDLPVAITRDGQESVSLREMLAGDRLDVIPTDELTDEQLTRLTKQRIESQWSFKLRTLRFGSIDKETAIRELDAGSHVAESLKTIEKYTIKFALKLLEKAD